MEFKIQDRLLKLAILFSVFASADASNFSEKYFAVYFDPVVSRHDVMDDTYDEGEIIFMVSLISTRFKRLIMRSIGEEDIKTNVECSSAKVPLAVAKFNKFQRNPSESPLELIMLFRYYASNKKSRWKTSFDFVKGMADKANQVFPGTVTHLMLDLHSVELSSKKIATASGFLAYSKSKLDDDGSPSPYKLGAIVKKYMCYVNRNGTRDLLAQLLAHVQTIMFVYPTAHSDFKFGVDPNAIQPYYASFESCKALVIQMSFPNVVEVMYKVGWPGLSTKKAYAVLNLVHFWELMNSWAVRSETPVVLHKAFDNKVSGALQFENMNQSTGGWWRLVESSEYVTALDYVFEEKIIGITNRTDNDDASSPMIPSWLTSCFPNTTGNSSNFNVPNLAVAFNPYMSSRKGDVSFNNYKEGDFYPLLRLVSTEFTTILVEAIPSYDADYNALQVPIAVAKLNKQGSFPSGPLQVVLVFQCGSCRNPKLSGSMSSGFALSQKVAVEANAIFPSSVPTLLIKYDYLIPTSVNHVVRELVAARSKLTLNPTNQNQTYRLGALFPMRDCESSRTKLNPALLPILEHVDLLIFDLAPQFSITDNRLKSRPTNEDFLLDVEESLGGYLRLLRFCTAKIHRYKENLEVGYMLAWPDTSGKGVQNVGKLVEFWGKVRKWAEETNTTVFMSAAFDTQFQGNPIMSTRGWWRLIHNDSYGNTSDYVFEDKKSVFLRELSEQSANLSSQESNVQYINVGGGAWTKNTIIASVVAAGVLVLVVFVFVACGVAVVVPKYRKGHVALLTKEEMYDFFNGDGTSLSLHPGNMPSTAYNRDLECSKEEFQFDEDKILGQGEFGIVYRATLRKVGEGAELDVAAKTTKSSFSSTALKGILSEIRILGYLGSHDNIVSIVGAYTAELHLGKVFMFTELCTLGSLEDILLTIQPIMIASLNNNMTECNAEGEQGRDCDDGDYVDQEDFEVAHNASSVMTITPSETFELMKWAHEISCGMEFLASKHVVHTDLAVRNVLLSKDRTAKITDFGLSRRLYDCQSYVKKQKEPLPWRTMAPESLRHLEFNEKTDVWAFGVTLWEIFSLGEIPYAGLMWSADFVNILENGLRLTQPRYSSKNMFSIMSKCWELDKNERPKFSDLKAILERRLSAYTKLGGGGGTEDTSL